MTAAVLSIVPNNPPVPSDLSANLRELADAVDRGEVHGLEMAFVRNGCYEFQHATTPGDAVILSSLLHASCVDRLRG